MDVTTVGTAGMVLACVCSVIAFGFGLANHRFTVAALRTAAAAGFVAVAALVVALINGAFELVYVADTTTRATPLPYRISGLWGAMEGSLLFWSWLHLALGSFAVGRLRARRPDAAPTASAVVGAVAATELGLGLWFSFPFTTLAIPAVDGSGLVAVLRHPAMVIHPPLLYLGLTLTIVPFAFLVAAARGSRENTADGQSLNQQRVEELSVLTRPWIRAAWLLLTIGMLIGASWAYVEAGWGGFWAWDSVENTSLLPWLALTGALHASGSVPHRKAFVWFVLLAFASTAMGVVLTRSGTTGSVHAFAEATSTGRGLLVLTIVVLGLSAAVAWRLRAADAAVGSGTEGSTSSSDRLLAPYLRLNNLVLAAAWFVIAAGTFVPSVSRLLGGPASTSDADFYVRFAGPVALIGLVGVVLLFAGDRLTLRRALVAACIPMVGLVVALLTDRPPVVVAVVISAVFAITFMVGTGIGLITGRSSGTLTGGLVLAHLGLAILLGASAASALGQRSQGIIAVGETIEVGDQAFRVGSITTDRADEYQAIRVSLRERRSDELVITELRRYDGQIRPSTEAALLSGVRRDTLVILQDVADDAGSARLTILVKPLVMWVWVGGLVMIAGALLHALQSRGTSAGSQAGEPLRPVARAEPQPATSTT